MGTCRGLQGQGCSPILAQQRRKIHSQKMEGGTAPSMNGVSNVQAAPNLPSVPHLPSKRNSLCIYHLVIPMDIQLYPYLWPLKWD